jgi:hypothetical protein
MSNKLIQEEWIKACTEKHNGKYDYSLVDLNNRREDGKVPIICHNLDNNGKEHGIFWQKPNQHKWGKGCLKCKTLTTNEFLERVSQTYKNQYDFSEFVYNGALEKSHVICKICGNSFPISPHNILKGRGCPNCRKDKARKKFQLPIEVVKKRIEETFGKKYTIENINYKNVDTPITLICPIHGEFEQTPYMLFKGHGCQKCGQSSLENEIQVFLNKNNIETKYEYSFEWLGRQTLDFYLPQYNVGIECQGIQHFMPQAFGGVSKEEAEAKYEETIRLDEQKRRLCEENGVKLFYYSNLGIEYPYKVFEDKKDLLNNILIT